MTGTFTIIGAVLSVDSRTSRTGKDYKIASFSVRGDSEGDDKVCEVALFGDAAKCAETWVELDIVSVSGELKPEIKDGRNGGTFVNWSIFANKAERLVALGEGLQRAAERKQAEPQPEGVPSDLPF